MNFLLASTFPKAEARLPPCVPLGGRHSPFEVRHTDSELSELSELARQLKILDGETSCGHGGHRKLPYFRSAAKSLLQ